MAPKRRFEGLRRRLQGGGSTNSNDDTTNAIPEVLSNQSTRQTPTPSQNTNATMQAPTYAQAAASTPSLTSSINAAGAPPTPASHRSRLPIRLHRSKDNSTTKANDGSSSAFAPAQSTSKSSPSTGTKKQGFTINPGPTSYIPSPTFQPLQSRTNPTASPSTRMNANPTNDPDPAAEEASFQALRTSMLHRIQSANAHHKPSSTTAPSIPPLPNPRSRWDQRPSNLPLRELFPHHHLRLANAPATRPPAQKEQLPTLHLSGFFPDIGQRGYERSTTGYWFHADWTHVMECECAECMGEYDSDVDSENEFVDIDEGYLAAVGGGVSAGWGVEGGGGGKLSSLAYDPRTANLHQYKGLATGGEDGMRMLGLGDERRLNGTKRALEEEMELVKGLREKGEAARKKRRGTGEEVVVDGGKSGGMEWKGKEKENGEDVGESKKGNGKGNEKGEKKSTKAKGKEKMKE